MTITKPTLLLSSALALTLGVLTPGAQAANQTWSGAGTDDNWATPANWSSAAPANNDTLTFSGTTRQNNTNNLNNLTAGWVSFANGGFALNGNLLTLNPTTAGIFTNAAGTNTIANDLVITPAAKYWSVAPGSELRLSGVITNTSATGSAGWLVLTNGGTVRLLNSARSLRGIDLFQGTVMVDGGLVDASNDGIRLKPPTGSTAAVIITNTGTIRIGGGGNFRLGHNGTGVGSIAGAGSLSQATISSGTLELYGTATSIMLGDQIAGATGVFNQNGGLVWGSAGSGNIVSIGNVANADGTYNLNGGVLWIGQVKQGNSGATNVVFNFNGGTLKPTVSSSTFFQGLLTANVLSKGAIIDTTNLNITIGQNLAAGPGSAGGLTKLGTGTLTLSGMNTYTGPTIVSNGTLVTSSSSFLGGGAVTVASNASLYVSYTGGSLSASALTLGSSVTNSVTVDLGAFAYPSTMPMIAVGTLTGNGPALIHVAGSGLGAGSYALIGFNSASGLSNFKLGTLPNGVVGALVQSGNTLSLNIAMVPKNLSWAGSVNGNWDTTTFNWYDLNNGNTPTNYAQSGANGDMVTFGDYAGTGPTTVNLTGTMYPAQVIANNSFSYTLSGPGKISGAASLLKTASALGNLTLSTANDYTGGTILQAGNLYLGHDQALGLGALQMDAYSAGLASDSATARTLTNAVALTTNAFNLTLGDPVNTGVLTLNGPLDFGSLAGRTLTVNSDVVLGGPLSSSGGGFTTLTGPGRLIIKGAGQKGGLINHTGANVLIDGGTLLQMDGWRMMAQNGGSLLFAVTNGGAFIMTNSTTANFRVGYAGGDVGANNTLDIAGTVWLWGTSGNGNLVMGDTSASDTVNLRAGGRLICNALSPSGTAVTTVNCYGGTLTPINSLATFMQGLSNAYIWDGLTVDTTNLNITIGQALLGAGSGGLTKLGNGTLILSGTNTYTGTTTVSAGTLCVNGLITSSPVVVQSGATLQGTGTINTAITLNNNATLSPGAGAIGGLTNNNALVLPAGATTLMEVRQDGVTAADSLVGLTSITYGGTLVVTNIGSNVIAGATFKLFSAQSYSGSFSSLVLPPLTGGKTWKTSLLAIDGTISVEAAPSLFGIAPQSATVFAGGQVAFTASAAGNEPLWYQWYLNGNPINGATTNVLALANVQASHAGAYSVVVTNAFGAATSSVPAVLSVTTPAGFDQAIIAAGPSAYYKLNETSGTTAFDSFNGHHGTYQGAYTLGSAGPTGPGFVANEAPVFDGASGCVVVPRLIGSNSFTLAFWVKTSDTGGTPAWFNGKGLVDGEAAGVVRDFGSSLVGGNFAFGVGNPDTTVTSTTPINDGAWHFLAATWDISTGAMAIYVDGVENGTTTGPTDTRYQPANLRIGSLQTGIASGFLNGSVADVALYDTALSATQIQQIYAAKDENLAPPTLGYTFANGVVTLSWTGNFKLQAQTNALSAGLGTNWGDYPAGSSSPVTVPVNAVNGTVFFRLTAP